MDTEPTDAELAAFLVRYEAELAEPADEALEVAAAPAAVAIGFNLGRWERGAFRRALGTGAAAQLPVLVRYVVPRYLDQLAASVHDPAHRLGEARQRLMALTARVAAVKAAAYRDDDRRALADELNRVLTDAATATQALDALLALEERQAGPGAGDQVDALVRCPVAEVPVSVRWSCGRCVWRGADEATCYAPAARRVVLALDGRRLPGTAGLLGG